ncbi:NfeD family protein [Microcoleus sp. PH2017_14_LAR_D_A]|uniref:NfeD family protein n=1 Tax=Microcoleus sp. PH2017_14_LAR_D_A TaxID=2798825 RepID=UPI0025F52538|nr:NfeD family protein [Microcoleus sp. PH2017_14_LAR_D_A]
MFNVVKAFGSIFSTQGYSTANNLLIKNYVNTNFNYFNEEAVVDESIYPNQTGRVRFQGSWWPARCDRQITHYSVSFPRSRRLNQSLKNQEMQPFK